MHSFFEILYPFVALIALVGYLPQIKALFAAKEDNNALSILMWVLWSVANSVSLGYGVFVIADMAFIIVAALNFVLTILVTCLACYNRFYRFRDQNVSANLACSSLDVS